MEPPRTRSASSGDRIGNDRPTLVRALPSHLREPFYLRVVLDLSPHDIADLLHLPVSTVRGRLFRARKAIAESIRQGVNP